MSDCPGVLVSDTVMIETEELFDVLEIADLGPKGDKGDKGEDGNNADAIRKNPSFTYSTDGSLSRVDYEDGSFKVFTYTADSLIATITYQLGDDSGTRTFVFAGGNLIRIEDV